MEKKLVWVGVRESDIADIKNIFYKSITIHGSGKNGNISMEHELGKRFNHNGEISEYDDFFQKSMYEILEAEPDSMFVQYDSLDSVNFSADLKKKIGYTNSEEILRFLNDKVSHKIWAKKYVDILPYKLIPADRLKHAALKNVFPDSKRLVIQRSFSCGGEGTFLVSADTEDLSKLLSDDSENCIVTEYQENNVSINLHAVIYEKEVLLFPPSIQLISYDEHRLKYIGSDFTAYSELTQEEKELVKTQGLSICNALRVKGYLGVCGIDMILANGNCYFMEVNGRFQASSVLLNRHLVKNGFPALQVYHMDAFTHQISSLPSPPHTADGSMITFAYQDQKSNALKWLHAKLHQSNDFYVCDDSLFWNREIVQGSYLFQLRCDKAMSSVTYQHTVRLHPNVKICSYELDESDSYMNLLKVKILLLSRGVSISPSVWHAMQNVGEVDWEEFGAVTLKLFDKIWVTSPCLETWHTISPIELDFDSASQQTILKYYGEPLFPVEIMRADLNGEKQTSKGHFVKDILYMNPDRLRVYHRDGCALQDMGLGCKFCDLYGVKKPFDFDEICEALSFYKDDDRVEHYLIGGGSGVSDDQYDMILKIARHLNTNSGKHIYLMSQPINDRNVLNKLKVCGITEIAFNIEMFNRNIAKKVMPGKSFYTLQDYYNSLKLAVEIWGSTGNVRSAILLGFDDIEEFEQGVRELCMMGVSPILSLFRPCSGTPLESFMSLDETDVFNYYEIARAVCEEFGMKLGPSCKACQNNTVALDI